MNLIAGADPGLLGLQSVWEGADLEHQEVESVQNFSAINDSISQSMTGFTMGQRARNDTVEKWKVTLIPLIQWAAYRSRHQHGNNVLVLIVLALLNWGE